MTTRTFNQVADGTPEDAIARILAGDEDIVIGAKLVQAAGGLAFRVIEFSPLVFITSKSHPAPSLSDWSENPMILSERGLARRRVDEWFRALGVQPRIYAQVAGNEAIVSMVSLGFGVGGSPDRAGNSPLAHTIRVLDVEPRLDDYEVGLFTLEKRLSSPMIQAFWSQLRVKESDDQNPISTLLFCALVYFQLICTMPRFRVQKCRETLEDFRQLGNVPEMLAESYGYAVLPTIGKGGIGIGGAGGTGRVFAVASTTAISRRAATGCNWRQAYSQIISLKCSRLSRLHQGGVPSSADATAEALT